MSRRWTLNGQSGFEKCLKYEENVPKPRTLGQNEVLVELYAASLNYRELAIANAKGSAARAGPIRPEVVPGSDGAGVVKEVGASVSTFTPGDHVITHLAPRLVERSGDEELPAYPDIADGLGQVVDGTLRSEGVFPEAALVLAPKSLNWSEAATLTCSGLTAWNSLFGLKGREPGPGTWVLVQGTGGVSIAALQLAVAAGATVVATTSSEEKAKRLRDLGATYTVSYRENPDDWGMKARSVTPNQNGFDIVVDIAGDDSLTQSLTAVRTDGTVVAAGLVGGQAEPVPMLAALGRPCIVRGVLLGSRAQFREMVRFVEEKGVKPVVDDVEFELAEVKDAYARLEAKKHFSKIVIKIDH
ncbi:zinc-binding alcohol dehydrogenase [Colletotrichum tofieldiae]|uniref:Zinc-binding alcohol dehydrogenase n=1 Tax=Colletotrichum tofieldiae TaxID=708197 RepID=A0A166YAM6_9PEZI|nr:zinc-binding alcohol dehydrogenase [Colletotrichum tofieldiae]GKT58293.1 zinc-binding alcohol dehydrogenase [Colletotrichum tofieldiae]GKT79800.1 zinc-binding alcohol dehydrogenase [Colletotrichum tofieldiae]GKT84373.1 zinc-binding alcohol dehydrogenase [Colletotrichum tofieldiae]